MDKNLYKSIITREEYKLVNELVSNGKLKEYRYLIDMFEDEKYLLLEMMDKNPTDIYNEIIKDYLKIVKGISMITPGLSTGIKDSKSGVSIYTYDGETFENHKIDENTRFDLASSTKLFTSIETLKLAEEGKIDLSKNVSQVNSKYKNLNIPIEKMAKFYYDLRTDGRLDEDISLKELEKRLYSTKVNLDNTFLYSDIPFIILKDLLPSADDYFKKYFNDEMNMLMTSYDNFGIITGSKDNNIHDPKAKIFEKYNIYPGHAGIYSTSRDLIKLFDSLNNGFLSSNSIKKLITPVHDNFVLLNDDGSLKFKKDKDGNDIGIYNVTRAMGVYIKHPEGIRASELTDALSNEAFAITGFTGCYAAFDLKNGLSANILANPLSNDNVKEFLIDNNLYTIEDCHKKFKDGVKFKVYGKVSQVSDDKIPFTRITNTLKESQIYTLLKLRLAKNALIKKAEIMNSKLLEENIKKSFENLKVR